MTLILANSPQAKGRIERLWGTFQDRLVSELRRAQAKTQAQAQAVLERYLPEHDRKFSKPAAKTVPAWRKVSLKQIEQSLCFKQQRTVAKDNTVSFEGSVFQIPKTSPYRSYANKRIDVHAPLDGGVEFLPKRKNRLLRLQNNARIWLISNERQAGRAPYGLFPLYQLKPLNYHPDISTLLLP